MATPTDIFKSVRPKSLAARTLLGIFMASAVRGGFILLSAGTLYYWQAWTHLAIFTMLVTMISAYLWRTDPKLLERRLFAGSHAEKLHEQKVIQRLTALCLIVLFVVCGLDHRYMWAPASTWVVVFGNIFVILGHFFIVLVFKENTYAASTISIFENQQVISTGPYALVRHPMYLGILVATLGIPLALGSLSGLVPVLGIALLTVWRLRAEERFLLKTLSGYPLYCQQVRYRLVPYAW